jgi:hypothetical protein
MLKKTFTLLAVVVCVAGAMQAQTTQNISAPMTLTLAPFLSCVDDAGISYGTVHRTDGSVSTSLSNFAQWECDADPNATLSYTFTLPTQMTNPSATGLPIPLTFGSTSAFVNCNGTVFNPAAGLSNDICPGGHVVIQLGVPRTNGASDLVSANVSNASPAGGGHYSATIVLNVTSN